MPKMGIKPLSQVATPAASLADALFSGTQQRVLGLLFGQPDRSFYATELIGLAGVGSGGVQRELARLAQSGLVTVRPVGNQKHYQANPDSPIYAELCGIARKTVGLAEPLREALAPLAAQIKALLFVGGVMNLAWIAALSVVVAIEKLAPHGERVAAVLGLALIAAGAIRLLTLAI